jgi:hypothetical protein
MLKNVQSALLRRVHNSVVGRNLHVCKNSEPLQIISVLMTHVFILINTFGSARNSLDCPLLDTFPWPHNTPVSSASPPSVRLYQLLPPPPHSIEEFMLLLICGFSLGKHSTKSKFHYNQPNISDTVHEDMCICQQNEIAIRRFSTSAVLSGS